MKIMIQRQWAHLLAVASLGLAGCEPSPHKVKTERAPTAATQASDPGAIAFFQCASCHTVAAGDAHKVGPNLHGLFGVNAGSKADYSYSAALMKSGIVWNRSTLDRWLTNPHAMVPATKMAFVGVPDPAKRAALIAYLERETSAGREPK